VGRLGARRTRPSATRSPAPQVPHPGSRPSRASRRPAVQASTAICTRPHPAATPWVFGPEARGSSSRPCPALPCPAQPLHPARPAAAAPATGQALDEAGRGLWPGRGQEQEAQPEGGAQHGRAQQGRVQQDQGLHHQQVGAASCQLPAAAAWQWRSQCGSGCARAWGSDPPRSRPAAGPPGHVHGPSAAPSGWRPRPRAHMASTHGAATPSRPVQLAPTDPTHTFLAQGVPRGCVPARHIHRAGQRRHRGCIWRGRHPRRHPDRQGVGPRGGWAAV
jgi:hypothetical protein